MSSPIVIECAGRPCSRRKPMWRRLLAVVSLVVAVSAIGCDEANPVGPTGLTSTDALITALRGQHATVVRSDVLPQSSNPFFSTNAQVLIVNGGTVSVFEYGSVTAAEGAGA